MSHSLLERLGLQRAMLLNACFLVKADLGNGDDRGPEVHGELRFIVGVGKDANTPVVHVDALNLIVEESDQLGRGSGTPSLCLAPGDRPQIAFDPRSKTLAGSFEAMIDFPSLRIDHESERNTETDTPGPTAYRANVELKGQIVSDFRPVEFGFESIEAEITIELPGEIEEKLQIQRIFIPVVWPLIWFRFSSRRTLKVQPVFISAAGGKPPTGADFYPGLHRANELWGKCCISFTAKCPKYVNEQDFRIATEGEAIAFKNGTNVADAIEVFIVESLDPIDLWGGGATFASGSATAKIVSTDNQLPLNQNHMAHELGHVLGLGHPSAPNGLTPGCAGSVLEPSGFFADNPSFQCEANCDNASNPLLQLSVPHFCIDKDRPAQQLF